MYKEHNFYILAHKTDFGRRLDFTPHFVCVKSLKMKMFGSVVFLLHLNVSLPCVLTCMVLWDKSYKIKEH